MKLKLKQLAFLLGGAAATGAASQLSSGTAHAATKTVKYEVKKGDNAWKIAKEHKTSLKKLVKENHLKNNGNLIYVGQKLTIDEGEGFKADLNTAKANSNTRANTAQQSTPVTRTQVSQNNTPRSNYSNVSAGANTQKKTTTSYTSNASGSEKAAKEWIASRESSGSYSAQNGRYYGRYQLDLSYLHGDLSAANQEKVADNYVKSRYGSWSNAQNFWQSHGWY